jgi:ribonuclease J
MTDRFVFLPLGGCGEIGMNLSLYGFGPEGKEKWIIADLGVTFGHADTPGVDVICPDPAFIVERRRDLLGIVLTHGHEDHIGAVPYLWPRLKCPVYATPFTAELVRLKLADNGLEDDVTLKEIPLSGALKLGPFKISFVTLTHSILEPNALAIETPLGRVLHTGDWKIDPDPVIGERTDEAALRKLGDEGVLAMVCDSTNVFVPGSSGSEASVKDSLAKLVADKTGRVAVTAFASNLARIETIARVAAAHGRRPVLVGRAMHRLVGAARTAGYLGDWPALIEAEEAKRLPRHAVLYICTGSQGEPRAALSRIVEGNHPSVTLETGDTLVFSSRVIPGNERAIFALMNAFVAHGIEVISDAFDLTHVSGHPCRDELARMYQWVRPRVSIPVHGELRHLAEHVKLAKSLQIPDALMTPNGALVQLAPGAPQVIDHVPAGRLHVDGDFLLPADDGTIAARRKLAFAGHVVALLVFDRKGRLAADPRIAAKGLPQGADDGDIEDRLIEDMEAELSLAIEAMAKGQAQDDDAVEEVARKAIRSVLRESWGRKPVISIEIVRLES